MLTKSARTAVAAALDQLRAATERQEAAAESAASGINGWWASTIGADSSAAALRTNAKSARLLYETMKRKADTLDTDLQAQTFVREVGQYADTRAIEAAANFLKPTTAAVEVGKATARDLANTAATVGTGWLAVLKASPFLVAGIALVILWRWGNKRAGTE